MITTPTTRIEGTPLFDADAQRKLLAARDEIYDYLPRGVLSDIAREVRCSREFVRQVLQNEDTFNRMKSDKAFDIWTSITRIAAERRDDINRFKEIIETLRKGLPVQVTMNSTSNRSLARKLKMLAIRFSVTVSTEVTPHVYHYTAKPVAKRSSEG
jgi:hypothetical protein